jgi:hypothetical protein
VCKPLAGGRRLRAGVAAETGDAAAAAHGCRDRLLELCCLLLRALCGAHPSARWLIAAISFETTETTITKCHKHDVVGVKNKIRGRGGGKNYVGDTMNGTWSHAAVGHAIRAAGAVSRG